jgi:hypothetical protein
MMNGFRKWVWAGMTALALAAPLAFAPPARANPPAASQCHKRFFYAYVRDCPDSPWACIGPFDSYDDARAVAGFAGALGYDAYIAQAR